MVIHNNSIAAYIRSIDLIFTLGSTPSESKSELEVAKLSHFFIMQSCFQTRNSFTLSILLACIVFSLFPIPTTSMNKKPPPEIKEYPGFGRECSQSSDCKFSPGGVGNGTIYFACKKSEKLPQSYCFCGTGTKNTILKLAF